MKKNNLVKAGVTLALAGVMMMGSVASVSAVVNETQTTSETPKAMETEVVYTQESNFTVEIPKTITLDSSKTADYTVNVSGDISSDKQVSVKPDATFAMKDQAAANQKADVTATVTQEKTVWSSADVCAENGTEEVGNISATDLSAGNWKGTFNFAIEMTDVQ